MTANTGRMADSGWVDELDGSRRVYGSCVMTVREAAAAAWCVRVSNGGNSAGQWAAVSEAEGRRMADEWLRRLCGVIGP